MNLTLTYVEVLTTTFQDYLQESYTLLLWIEIWLDGTRIQLIGVEFKYFVTHNVMIRILVVLKNMVLEPHFVNWVCEYKIRIFMELVWEYNKDCLSNLTDKIVN